MEYDATQLWPAKRIKDGPFYDVPPDAIREHMAEQAEQGWRLVSANAVPVTLGPTEHGAAPGLERGS